MAISTAVYQDWAWTWFLAWVPVITALILPDETREHGIMCPLSIFSVLYIFVFGYLLAPVAWMLFCLWLSENIWTIASWFYVLATACLAVAFLVWAWRSRQHVIDRIWQLWANARRMLGNWLVHARLCLWAIVDAFSAWTRLKLVAFDAFLVSLPLQWTETYPEAPEDELAQDEGAQDEAAQDEAAQDEPARASTKAEDEMDDQMPSQAVSNFDTKQFVPTRRSLDLGVYGITEPRSSRQLSLFAPRRRMSRRPTVSLLASESPSSSTPPSPRPQRSALAKSHLEDACRKLPKTVQLMTTEDTAEEIVEDIVEKIVEEVADGITSKGQDQSEEDSEVEVQKHSEQSSEATSEPTIEEQAEQITEGNSDGVSEVQTAKSEESSEEQSEEKSEKSSEEKSEQETVESKESGEDQAEDKRSDRENSNSSKISLAPSSTDTQQVGRTAGSEQARQGEAAKKDLASPPPQQKKKRSQWFNGFGMPKATAVMAPLAAAPEGVPNTVTSTPAQSSSRVPSTSADTSLESARSATPGQLTTIGTKAEAHVPSVLPPKVSKTVRFVDEPEVVILLSSHEELAKTSKTVRFVEKPDIMILLSSYEETPKTSETLRSVEDSKSNSLPSSCEEPEASTAAPTVFEKSTAQIAAPAVHQPKSGMEALRSQDRSHIPEAGHAAEKAQKAKAIPMAAQYAPVAAQVQQSMIKAQPSMVQAPSSGMNAGNSAHPSSDVEMTDSASEPVVHQTNHGAEVDMLDAPNDPTPQVQQSACQAPISHTFAGPEHEMTDAQPSPPVQAQQNPGHFVSQTVRQPLLRSPQHQAPQPGSRSIFQHTQPSTQSLASTVFSSQWRNPFESITQATTSCRRCRKSEICSRMSGFCKDCNDDLLASCAGKRSTDDVDAYRPSKHARLSVPTLIESGDPNDMEVDYKSVDRTKGESGFNGTTKPFWEYYVDRDDKLSLNMYPSAVNWPLHYIDQSKSQRLIRDWLYTGSQEVRLLFSRVSGLFQGPEFAVFKLGQVICRLEQIIEYAIQDGRWRGDRIEDYNVKPYRDVMEFRVQCFSLESRMQEWQKNNMDTEQKLIDASTKAIDRIKKLAEIIEKAKRPDQPVDERVRLVIPKKNQTSDSRTTSRQERPTTTPLAVLRGFPQRGIPGQSARTPSTAQTPTTGVPAPTTPPSFGPNTTNNEEPTRKAAAAPSALVHPQQVSGIPTLTKQEKDEHMLGIELEWEDDIAGSIPDEMKRGWLNGRLELVKREMQLTRLGNTDDAKRDLLKRYIEQLKKKLYKR